MTVGIWSSMHWFSHYRMVFCARFGHGQPYLNQSWRQVSNLCLSVSSSSLVSWVSQNQHPPATCHPLHAIGTLLSDPYSFFMAFHPYLYNPTPLRFLTRLSCSLTPGLFRLAAPCTLDNPF